MEGLPLIPGYSFHDPTIREYKLVHKFDFINGFRVTRDSNIGIGGRPNDAASLAYITNPDTVRYDPSLTYGRVQQYAYSQVIPHYALFAQKCLLFKAFFRQGVFNSPDEHYRIRYVNILYFLEDDTITVMEPIVENAGFDQGRLVRRERIVKNTIGDFFHWKDFNIGIDVCIYGVVYHIIDCDLFTREFLNSQGIDVGDQEIPPIDPYTETQVAKRKTPSCVTKIPDDSRRRFLEYDRMVLSFNAIWNEHLYQIMYFLTDDTIAVREILKPNSGKDPVAMLLKRMKVPKDWKHRPSNYPAIYMEFGDSEVIEYYVPKDFKVGGTVFIFGRSFYLYGCDAFTRKYYKEMLGFTQPDNIQLPTKEKRTIKFVPPPHIKFGTPEDTYASCLSFMLKPPKKDVIRQLTNFPKKLRYSMQMDAVHPEDKNRDFVLEYNLSQGTILITELEKRNSGRREGCFLNAKLVPKPGVKEEYGDPVYYTPNDFFIGAKINIFNHYFVINGADLFVYRYIQANPEKFCQEVRDNIRNYFAQQGLLQNEIDKEVKRIEEVQDAQDVPVSTPQKDSIDIDTCIEEYKMQARQKYEGEDETKPDKVPLQELCADLAAANKN